MSLPLNWFLNPSETKENISYQINTYKNSDLYSYNKPPPLPYVQQIKEYSMLVPITTTVSNVLSDVSNYVGNMLEVLPRALNKAMEGVKEASSAAINEVGENFQEVSETLGEIVENTNPTPVKKSWPKVETPYIQNGTLHRIGAGKTRMRRRRSKSRSLKKHSKKRSYKKYRK